MADIRYNRQYERLLAAEDRASQLKQFETADLVKALAAASQVREPYIANIIATELEHRLGRPGPPLAGPPVAVRDGHASWRHVLFHARTTRSRLSARGVADSSRMTSVP